MKPEIKTFVFGNQRVDTMTFARKDGRKVFMVMKPHTIDQFNKWSRRYGRREVRASRKVYAKTIPVQNPVVRHQNVETAVERLFTPKGPTMLQRLRARFGFSK